MTFVYFSYVTFVEKLIRWSIHPKIRATLLGLVGANIGTDVRVCEIILANLIEGFRNLTLRDSAYVGPGCLIDLAGKVYIGERTSISPNCTLITHADPGSAFGNKLAAIYPRTIRGIKIGSDTWIGADVTILCGVTIGSGTVIGAGSMVNIDIPDNVVAAGNPVRIIKSLNPVDVLS